MQKEKSFEKHTKPGVHKIHQGNPSHSTGDYDGVLVQLSPQTPYYIELKEAIDDLA
jgi:hypothetical protein